MKRKIIEKHTPIVEVQISEITDSTIVGYRGISNYKGFIGRIPGGDYGAIHSNLYGVVSNETFETVKQAVQHRLKQHPLEIYAFDSVKELYQWLAE